VNEFIVCLTPLHVLIGRALAQSRGINFNVGVYVGGPENERTKHYTALLSTFCKEVRYIRIPTTSPCLQKHIDIGRLRWKFSNCVANIAKGHRVYSPSSINDLLYVFLSKGGQSELCTYDDGWLNVQPNSLLAQSKTSLPRKLFGFITNCNYWPEKVKNHSRSHYSIYSSQNYSDRVITISLFNEIGGASASSIPLEQGPSFFIAPSPETPEIQKEACRRFVRERAINFLFPHPRELNVAGYTCQTITSPMIIEDYLLSERAKHPTISSCVYGLESSALLNLARVPGIKAHSILRRSPNNLSTWMLMKKEAVTMLDDQDHYPSPVGDLGQVLNETSTATEVRS